MAEVNTKVMDMIAEELKKNPDLSNKELFEKSIAIDKSIGKLSPRQFNARYPLQVKRNMAPRKPAGRKRPRRRAAAARGAAESSPPRSRSAAGGRKGGQGADSRDRVRGVLLELSRDVANAQGTGEVVDVIVGIDRYVDRILKAVG
jgi:hypothetical protein